MKNIEIAKRICNKLTFRHRISSLDLSKSQNKLERLHINSRTLLYDQLQEFMFYRKHIKI